MQATQATTLSASTMGFSQLVAESYGMPRPAALDCSDSLRAGSSPCGLSPRTVRTEQDAEFLIDPRASFERGLGLPRVRLTEPTLPGAPALR